MFCGEDCMLCTIHDMQSFFVLKNEYDIRIIGYTVRMRNERQQEKITWIWKRCLN